MQRLGYIGWGLILLMGGMVALAVQPDRTVEGLKNPESVVAGPDGAVYTTEIGEFDKAGDGRLLRITESGKVPLATGLDDPKGVDIHGQNFFVSDKTRILRIDAQGSVHVLAEADDFPRNPHFLNDVEIAQDGTLYVSDSGQLNGGGGAIFRISPQGEVTMVLSHEEDPQLQSPNGLLLEDSSTLLIVDLSSGSLYRLNLAQPELEKLNQGFGGGDGLARDAQGRLYVSDWQNGRVYWLKRPESEAHLLAENLRAAADIAIGPGSRLVVPDMKAGALMFYPLPQ